MKNLLLACLVSLPILFQGQDYHCIIDSGTSFFTDGENYRAIHIDSIASFGNYMSYYNYFTLGPEDGPWPSCFTDRYPSWIGRCVDVYENGDHYFFNRYGDSIFIKTIASLNEAWVSFSFDGGDYIQAKVIGIASEEFLGFTDTVKTIRFNAFDMNGNPVVCPCNDQTIKVSKSHGLIRTLNFRVFPDFYDWMTAGNLHEYDLCGLSEPETGTGNLTIADIYDFGPGDEMHIHEYSLTWPYANFYYYEIHRILDKSWVNDSVINYTLEQCYRREYILSDTIVFGHDTGSLIVNIYHHEDPNIDLLPETMASDESIFPELYFYRQWNDESTGKLSKFFYGGFYYDENIDCILPMIDYDISRYYLEGLGGPYWHYGSFGSESYRGPVYYKKGEEEWGEPYLCDSLMVKVVDNKPANYSFRIIPQPVHHSFYLNIEGFKGIPFDYELVDLTGKSLREGILDRQKNLLDRSDLPAGIYFLKISHDQQPVAIKKLIIQ